MKKTRNSVSPFGFMEIEHIWEQSSGVIIQNLYATCPILPNFTTRDFYRIYPISRATCMWDYQYRNQRRLAPAWVFSDTPL